VPTAFAFATNAPDGRIATISEPPNAHNGQVEFESADDFFLTSETMIRHASFTGLLTGGATLQDVSNVFITIYRVFPNDSDVSRTSGPPTFSTAQVPTRVNSPGDNEIENRDSAAGELNFRADVLSATFTATASVSTADKIGVASGGNGAVTGQEVEFFVNFRNHPLALPAGHYFFAPKVGLSDTAPAAADFLWLSAPRPIVPPGTPFMPDLQTWMRDDPGLAPDWLRIGADIIGGTTFNGSFSLSGELVHHAAAGGDSGSQAALALTGQARAKTVAAGTPQGPSLLRTDGVSAATAVLIPSGAQNAVLSGPSGLLHHSVLVHAAPWDQVISGDSLVFTAIAG
jgi:hypothetical protein